MAGGRRRTKPKDFEEFWPKYVNEINEIKRKLKQDKWLKLAYPIIIAIGVVIAYAIGAGWITSEKSPNTIAYEMIQRVNNTINEGYKLVIHNTGEKFAKNVRVKVIFPFQNTTIYKIYNFAEELTINESGGVGSYQYSIEYSKLRQNEEISLIIMVENKDFEKEGTSIVIPQTKIWTDEENEIDITYLEEVKFIY